LFYPEETSTGHFLTKIAEGLADKQPVTALCSQPTYSQRGILAPKQEIHDHVKIYRSWGGRFNKNHLTFRVFNFLTISFSLFLSGLLLFGRDDIVIVVTNPPLLPFLITIAAKLKRSKTVLLVHDVYPEVLVAAGIFESGTFFHKFILKLNKWLYNNVERIIVIGRDMQKLASSKCTDKAKIRLITNWADLDIIYPLPRSKNNLLSSMGLANKFVVQYCGNMGRTHGLEYLLHAAEELYPRLPLRKV
ncbi:MAG: glycosyltransferase family 4 protein, partial [Gammaproteobacteria bacterium]